MSVESATGPPTGEPLWIGDTAGLRALAGRMKPCRRFALDTEANGFHAYWPRLCLVQVAWEAASRIDVALVDPLALGDDLGPLRERIEDPGQETIVHGGDYDVRLLKRDADTSLRGLFDTEIAARLLGRERTGLAHLAKELAGVRLGKAGRRADWGRRPLPEAARRYAADDARVLFTLRDDLGDELQRAGRSSWAEEEFRRLETVEPDRSGPADARSIVESAPGSRSLDARARAVLLALVEWREGAARRMDRPPGFVVANRDLVGLARAAPESDAALRAARVPEAVVRRHGRAILRAVAAGEAAPPLPRPEKAERGPRPDREAVEMLARLKSRRSARARQLGLDPGVLCSAEILSALVRERPRDVEGLCRAGLRRWQADAVGPDLLDALGA